MRISKQYTFDAAHQLWDESLTEEENKTLFGKCSRPHGHTYTLEVELKGTIDANDGMVLNYWDLDFVVKPIVDRMDHQNLNDLFDVLTTSEHLARAIALEIHKVMAKQNVRGIVSMVSIQETPRTRAAWMADEDGYETK